MTSQKMINGRYCIPVDKLKKWMNPVFLKEPHINSQAFKSALSSALPMTGTTVNFILEGVNKYLLALVREQIQIAFEQQERKWPTCTNARAREWRQRG